MLLRDKSSYLGIKAPGAHCDKCPLNNQPFCPSDGPEQTTFAVVGIAPGRDEVTNKINGILTPRPFVGPSGKLLNPALEHAQLNRADILVTNVVLCKTPDNREPTAEEIECCYDRLISDLNRAGVTKVLTCGKVPRDVLAPELEKDSMNDTRGAWFETGHGFHILPTWHPAYILRGKMDAYQDVLIDCYKFGHVEPTEIQPPVKYLELTTLTEIQTVVTEALKSRLPICFDLETSNLDREQSTPEQFWNGFIILMQFHWLEDRAFLIGENLLFKPQTWKILKPLFEQAQGVYGHNITFDALYIKQYYKVMNITFNFVFADDSLLMAYLLDERKSGHSLKAQARYWFNAVHWEHELKKYLKNGDTSYCKIPKPVLMKYGAQDIQYSVALRAKLLSELETNGLAEYPYRQVIMKTVPTISRMEFRGMKIDMGKLAEAGKVFKAQVDNLKNDLCEISGRDINPNSWQQVSEVIYNVLGLRRKKSWKYKDNSTNKEALAELAGHPFIDTLAEYRKFAKLYSTYILGIPELCDQKGYAHFKFDFSGTVSGRLSGGLAMTIPRKNRPEGKILRECFIVEDDEILLEADYSQSEMRWLGFLAFDPFLHEVYADPDADLHAAAALVVFGPGFTKEQRNLTKSLNFSFAYSFEGSENAFIQDSNMPTDKAREVIRRYNQTLKRANEWKKEIYTQVKTTGQVRTPLGRLRRFPLITPDNMHHIRNEAINFPVQSVSSDSALLGFHSAEDHFRRNNWHAYPYLFLHDGVYFAVKNTDKEINRAARVLQSRMIESAEHIMNVTSKQFEEFRDLKPIPFKVDIALGRSWGQTEHYSV